MLPKRLIPSRKAPSVRSSHRETISLPDKNGSLRTMTGISTVSRLIPNSEERSFVFGKVVDDRDRPILELCSGPLEAMIPMSAMAYLKYFTICKNGPIPASFCFFVNVSLHFYSIIKLEKRRCVLGIRTRAARW